MKNKPILICYAGIYGPSAPRDKVYFDGLRKRGMDVVECADNSRGFLKFFRLAEKLRALRGNYDVLWVGYLSTMIVPLARLISKKKLVFNALDSWYDRTVRDRGMYRPFSPKAVLVWVLDFLAFHLADVSLVESRAQKNFLAKEFFLNPKKLSVALTGADPDIFFPDPSVKKRERFTVVFRGMFLPATGVEVVLEAAALLRAEPIDFIIIGWGPLLEKVRRMMSERNLANVRLITEFQEPGVLRELILSCHAMLGQFSGHQRMERTIQHKTSEALSLGMPYITRDSPGNRELLENGENCLFVPPDNPGAIADAIMRLRADGALRTKLSAGARKVYAEKLRPDILAARVADVISSISQ